MVRLLQVERSYLCSKSKGEGRLGLFRGLAAPFASTSIKIIRGIGESKGKTAQGVNWTDPSLGS